MTEKLWLLVCRSSSLENECGKQLYRTLSADDKEAIKK